MFRKLTATMLSSTVGVCSVLSVMVCDQRTLQAAIASGADFDSPEQSEPFESSGSTSGTSHAPRLPAVPRVESKPPSIDASSSAISSSKSDSTPRGALDSECDEEDPPIRAVAPPAQASPARSTAQKPPVTQKAAPMAARSAVTNKVSTRSGEPKAGVLGRIVGSVLVLPQSMYRQSVNEFHEGLKDLTNDSSNPCLVIPAAMITAPFSVAAGCVEGTASALHLGSGKDSQSTAAKDERKKVAVRKTSAISE